MTCADLGAEPATTASTERPTARNHRRADGLVADSGARGDLSERQLTCVDLGNVQSDPVRHLWSARCQACLPSYLSHRAAVHVESRRQLPHGHTCGVTGDQLGSIGGAQTGLTLSRSPRTGPRSSVNRAPRARGRRTRKTRRAQESSPPFQTSAKAACAALGRTTGRLSIVGVGPRRSAKGLVPDDR